MRYLGPSHTFYLAEGGKAYKRGEDVPISAEQARYMGLVKNGGHRFAGVEAEARGSGPSDIRAARAAAEESKA